MVSWKILFIVFIEFSFFLSTFSFYIKNGFEIFDNLEVVPQRQLKQYSFKNRRSKLLSVSYLDITQQNHFETDTKLNENNFLSKNNRKVGNAVIYKYVGRVTNKIYIGNSYRFTTEEIKENYKSLYLSYKLGMKHYMNVFDIIEHELYDVMTIETLNNITINELKLKTKEYINYYKNNNEYSHLLINKRNPLQTREEYLFQNHVNKRKYRLTIPGYSHNEYIKYCREYQLTKLTCECGSVVCRMYYPRHLNTNKHYRLMCGMD